MPRVQKQAEFIESRSITKAESGEENGWVEKDRRDVAGRRQSVVRDRHLVRGWRKQEHSRIGDAKPGHPGTHSQQASGNTYGHEQRITQIPADSHPYGPFVDAEVAAEFLSVKRKTILAWARDGAIPAHPFGRGKRVVWRFRISEIACCGRALRGTMNLAVLDSQKERNNG
jgi:excisionase family DNA binding protein